MDIGSKVKVRHMNYEIATIIDKKQIGENDYKYKIRYDNREYGDSQWLYEFDLVHGR
jgi:hypothetical protein